MDALEIGKRPGDYRRDQSSNALAGLNEKNKVFVSRQPEFSSDWDRLYQTRKRYHSVLKGGSNSKTDRRSVSTFP